MTRQAGADACSGEEPELYLASASPRRRQLLEQIGIRFALLPVNVPEVVATGESAESYVLRVALDKARAGWHCRQRRLERPVLGADTEVVLDGQVMGKPADEPDAMAMLARLSGRSHQVLSAVAVVDGARERRILVRSVVSFRSTTERERRAYCRSGEPLGKAGGYAVQGAAATFICRLEGSFSAVMGLPLFETAELLGKFNIHVFK